MAPVFRYIVGSLFCEKRVREKNKNTANKKRCWPGFIESLLVVKIRKGSNIPSYGIICLNPSGIAKGGIFNKV